MISKKFTENFEKCYNINAMKITSKQAIEEIASKSGGCDILYLYCIYVATENDHTVDRYFMKFEAFHFFHRFPIVKNAIAEIAKQTIICIDILSETYS